MNNNVGSASARQNPTYEITLTEKIVLKCQQDDSGRRFCIPFITVSRPVLGAVLYDFFLNSQCLVVAKFSMHHGPVHSVQR